MNKNLPNWGTAKSPTAKMFGQKLRAWRKSVGFPMKRVAEHLDVSVSIVCAWERGKRFPSVCHLERIAEYTGIRVQDFFLPGSEISTPGTRAQSVVEINEHGTILDAQRLPEGVSAEDMVGANIFDFVKDRGRPELLAALTNARDTGRPAEGNIPFRVLANGADWLSRIAPVSRRGETHRFLVVCSAPPAVEAETESAEEGTARELLSMVDCLTSTFGGLRKEVEAILSENCRYLLDDVTEGLSRIRALASRLDGEGAQVPEPVAAEPQRAAEPAIDG